MTTIASYKQMTVDQLEYAIVCLRGRCRQCIDSGDYDQLVKYALELECAADVMLAKPCTIVDRTVSLGKDATEPAVDESEETAEETAE